MKLKKIEAKLQDVIFGKQPTKLNWIEFCVATAVLTYVTSEFIVAVALLLREVLQ